MIINPLDPNKKRLEEQAKREGKALEERMRLQKEQAKKLKIDAKKRELEEIKRKVALKTDEKNGLVLALNDLKNKERAVEQTERNTGGTKFKEDDIPNKKQEKEKIRREIEQLESATEKKKKSGTQKAAQKQSEIAVQKSELDKLKRQEEAVAGKLEKLEQEISLLKNKGSEEASTRSDGNSDKIIEMKEARLREIKEEIRKLESEKSEIETEIRRKKELLKSQADQKKKSSERDETKKQSEIAVQKSELDKLKRQEEAVAGKLEKLEQEASALKNESGGGTAQDEMDLVRKINKEKELEREIEALGRNKSLSHSQGDSAKKTKEELKRKIEGEERRLATAEQELQKLTAEQNKLEQEIRIL